MERKWRIPFLGKPGQQVVLTFGSGEFEEGSQSEASTVPVGLMPMPVANAPALGSVRPEPVPLTAGPDHGESAGVPVDFQDFQKLYAKWDAGQLSDSAIRCQYGNTTMELMESQRLC